MAQNNYENSRHHQCLFIAYDFPPCRSIGSALRSMYFVKYLPEFGWKANVVTLAEPGELHKKQDYVVRIPSATPFSRPYEISPYGWAANLYKFYQTGKITHKMIDLIYVSCPPFPQTYTALRLKKIFRCPLVVDFRDAWSLDPYMEGSRLKRFLYKKIFPAVEKRVLQDADIFIANTLSMCRAYMEYYPFLKKKSVLIPNGYDENDFINSNPNKPPPDKTFTVLYCGRFGIGGRTPDLIFKAIKEFISRNGNVLKLKIIGDSVLLIKQHIADMNLEDTIIASGTVPHEKAIRHMFNADVLLLYQENTVANISAVAGKTYEYLRTGKPLLAIVPPGDNLDIIKQFSNRCELVSDYKVDTVLNSLTTLYGDWKNNLLPKFIKPGKNYIEYYNRRNLTQKLAQVFNSVTK